MAVVVLLLASVIFLCAALIGMALMLRGQWDKMGNADTREHSARPRR